jgi:lipopolysaccharide export LptBFGC system permease protein LptF
MAVSALSPVHRPGKLALAIAATVRVLFATLLFTAGGMGAGLLLGILVMVVWAAFHGGQADMRNAYRAVAIPMAALSGTVAFLGAIYLERRPRRT